jgi:hypothetical protein
LGVVAQDTVLVSPGRSGVDHALGLVVIAMEEGEVQAQWPGTKVAVRAGTTFTLAQPQTILSTGEAYAAMGENGLPYTMYFSGLPLYHIRTPHAIVDDPKVPAILTGWSGSELLEEQAIAIEIRGGSSQFYPKKSFLIELRTDTIGDEEMDLPLLGLRSDDDWNLQAGYIEPNRSRSRVGMELWSDIHTVYYAEEEPEARTGVRMNHLELFVNDVYQGLYTLSERCDRKQLKLKQHNGSIRGELYKGIGLGGSTFTSIPPPYAESAVLWGGWEHEHPEGYPNWGELSELVTLVVNGTQPGLHAELRERFHLPTMVDYHLFINVLKAEDNTGKNIYLARYDAGAPYFYEPWDLDATFGLSWNGQFNVDPYLFLSNGLYARWFTDLTEGGFVETMCERWTELRSGPITVSGIMDRFRSLYDHLAAQGVYEREELAWPAYTHDPDHLDGLESWLEERISYMDQELTAYCRLVSVPERQPEVAVTVYPNPASGRVVVEGAALRHGAVVEVVDGLGRMVVSTTAVDGQATINVSGISTGSYLVRLAGHVQITRKLMVE